MSSNKKPEQRVITKEKRVPAKVVIGGTPDIDFVPGQGPLKGSVVVIVSDGHRTFSKTFHHPLGITPLAKEDWVLSETQDIQDLVLRSKNEDANRLNQLRGQYRLELAVARGFLFQDPQGVIRYAGPAGPVRDEVVKAAREKADQDHKVKIAKYRKDHPEGADPPKATPYLDFMDPGCRVNEEAFAKFSVEEKTKQEVEGRYPDTFVTAAGPNWDRRQASATHDGVYPTAAQLMDGLVYQIDHLAAASFTDVKARAETGKWALQPKSPPAHAAPPGPGGQGGAGALQEEDPLPFAEPAVVQKGKPPAKQ